MRFFASLPFTATRWQIATYLLAVALFSISFLVFLNSTVSFVITDLIGQSKRVGSDVGTLGFADELVALVACPVWGLLSDLIGVRNVCVAGYTIVGLSLILFVQAKNVFPQLLLARLLFGVGGAATATMVTAILPTMTSKITGNEIEVTNSQDSEADRASSAQEVAHEGSDISGDEGKKDIFRSGNSNIAGLVGMFTGVGALVALAVFLPLPARLGDIAGSPGKAIALSFYIVAIIAFTVALVCALGLRGLPGEEYKGLRALIKAPADSLSTSFNQRARLRSLPSLGVEALTLAFKDHTIGLAYLGGFVARASSVAISLFIPLYINAYFITSGRCTGGPRNAPTDIKQQCERAYKLAAALTGVSQVSALAFAPVFGYFDGKLSRSNAPILLAALAGICGYVLLARNEHPDPKTKHGSAGIFGVMVLLGLSQIGAIVCSLSMLARGIQAEPGDRAASLNGKIQQNIGGTDQPPTQIDGAASEETALLAGRQQYAQRSRDHLKGSIAGMYSFAGGAGILLLTKLGGSLFDSLSNGAPFYMLAIFNGILFIASFANLVYSKTHGRS